MHFWQGNYVDTAQITLYAFWIFFAGLIVYLQREGKREGFPLVSEVEPYTHEVVGDAVPQTPPPKMFRLLSGIVIPVPPGQAPRFPEGARPIASFPGAPLEPTGNPLVDGIGPASWCHRIDEPEIDSDGTFKIKPLRIEEIYRLDPNSHDPRGMIVVGADGLTAGTVVDIWIDALEEAALYLEVSLTLPAVEGQHVLVPTRSFGTRPCPSSVPTAYRRRFPRASGSCGRARRPGGASRGASCTSADCRSISPCCSPFVRHAR